MSLSILTLRGNSVPLSSSWVLLGNVTPLLSQQWGCKCHHRKLFSSSACAEPWVSVMHFHQAFSSSGKRKNSSSSAKASVRKARRNSGKETPSPPAEVLLRLLDTVLVLKSPSRKMGLSSSSCKESTEGGQVPLFTLSSLTAFISSLKFPAPWLQEIPLKGWQHFVCWRKPYPAHAPALSPELTVVVQNTGLTVYTHGPTRSQPQELRK